jgi:hypothetical protein
MYIIWNLQKLRQLVCACVLILLFLLLVCLLDLVIHSTNVGWGRGALNLVNKGTVGQRCSYEKENLESIDSCFMSLIILTKYVVDEVLLDHLFGLLINYWIVILYEKENKYKIDSCQFIYSYFIWYHTDKIQMRNFSDIITLKFSWDVNFIVNLFITLLV